MKARVTLKGSLHQGTRGRFAAIIVLLSAALYLGGCSSAEQTTGMLAYQQGDYAKAEQEFMKELNRNPSNEEAWFYLGASRLFLNKYKEAEEAFTQYRKIGKNSYKDQIEDAWVKRYNSGADKFEAAQKGKTPDEQVKLFNEAVDEFKVCLILLPDSAFVQKYIDNINSKIALILIKPFLDKGVELLEQEKFEEAVNEFKKGLTIGLTRDNPNYFVIQYNVGVTYLKWGEKMRIDSAAVNSESRAHLDKYKEALVYLEELKNSPDKNDQLTAYELLVQVYGNLNMSDKALEAIKRRDELRAELGK